MEEKKQSRKEAIVAHLPGIEEIEQELASVGSVDDCSARQEVRERA